MPGPLVVSQDDIVGQHIQFLLGFTLNVGGIGIAQDIAQRAQADEMGNLLDGAGHVLDDAREVRTEGMEALFMVQKRGQGNAMVHAADFPSAVGMKVANSSKERSGRAFEADHGRRHGLSATAGSQGPETQRTRRHP